MLSAPRCAASLADLPGAHIGTSRRQAQLKALLQAHQNTIMVFPARRARGTGKPSQAATLPIALRRYDQRRGWLLQPLTKRVERPQRVVATAEARKGPAPSSGVDVSQFRGKARYIAGTYLS